MKTWLPILFTFSISSVLAEGKTLYYSTTLDKVQLTEGSEFPKAGPAAEKFNKSNWRTRNRLADSMFPYVVVSEGQTIFLARERSGMDPRRSIGNQLSSIRICAEADSSATPSGKVYLPNQDWTGMDAYTFQLTSVPVRQKEAKAHFFQTKAAHYQRLQNLGVPGSAWYRHQIEVTREELEKVLDWNDYNLPLNANASRNWNRGNLDNTYNLVSGGRAVSENLQLDRDLRIREGGKKDDGDDVRSVEAKTIPGITIAEMDWENRIDANLGVAPLPLANAVPHDQYFIHFQSFAQLVGLVDNSLAQGTPLQRLVENRSENAQTFERYEDQLLLPLDEAVRKFGPKLVEAVAVTGSDPNFRTGTDVTILLQAKDPKALHTLLALRMKAAGFTTPAKATKGELHGLSFQGIETEDGSTRSFLAMHGKTVVVSNSKGQLKKILGVILGLEGSKAISSLPEYTWFRQRYEGNLKPFFLVTDAAIRRWCSPQWRIGNSRRTQAAAILAELQARKIAGPEDFKICKSEIPDWLGEVTMLEAGPQSSTYGNLAFLTPISELEIDLVTPREHRAYNNFRNRYQSRWRNFFDPIGGTISIGERDSEVDITVLPLIEGSEYNEIRDVAGNVRFASDAANPSPDSLLHAIIALDTQGPDMRRVGTFASRTSPTLGVNALSWLGKHASIQLMDAPFWKDLAVEVAGGRDPENFVEQNIHRLPVLAKLDVKNPFVMTAFLGTFRAFLDQTSPGMLAWDNRTHNDQTYVRVGLTETTKKKMEGDSGWKEIALYYRVEPTLLTLSLREDVIQKSMEAPGEVPESHHWAGESMGVQINGQAIPQIQNLAGEQMLNSLQSRSWNNLQILNEWRRNLGIEDAGEYHLANWHTRLECPGGGEYVWDEAAGSYVSTVFGHPSKPKMPCEAPSFFNGLQHASFGLTFEQDGLRARTKWSRK